MSTQPQAAATRPRPRTMPCPRCNGEGSHPDPNYRTLGRYPGRISTNPPDVDWPEVTCHDCTGTGALPVNPLTAATLALTEALEPRDNTPHLGTRRAGLIREALHHLEDVQGVLCLPCIQATEGPAHE